MLHSLLNEIETHFRVRITHFPQYPKQDGKHPETEYSHFRVANSDYTERPLFDCEFRAIADWLENRGLLATRQLAWKNTTEHVLMAPLERREIPIGYHATRTDYVASIFSEGLKLGDRDRSTSPISERIDQIGNIYVAEELGNPGDEASRKYGTAHWWREHKSTRNCFDDPDWSILRIDLSGLPDLRLYRDPWSKTGLILRSEISCERITKIA